MRPRRPCSPRPSRAVSTALGVGGQRVVAARLRPPGARAGRGVARDGRRRTRRPAVRGRLHRRRHRERQPRGQGPVLGPPRGRPAPHPRARQRRRAPRRARRRRVAGRARGRRRSPGCEVDRLGRVDPDGARARALADDVALVSVMWANNEVGTVQPVGRAGRRSPTQRGVPLHTDAVQAVGQLPVDFAASGADALTVTGHKFGGPLGAGALLLGARPSRARRCCTAAARSATSAPGTARRRRRSPASPSPPRLAVERQPETRRPARRAARRPRRPRARTRCPTPCSTATPSTGCRATRTSPSPAARATRCSCCSTPAASRCSTGSACSAGVARPRHVLVAIGADDEAGPQLAALLARPHLHRRRRRRAARRAARRRRAGREPGRPAPVRVLAALSGGVD